MANLLCLMNRVVRHTDFDPPVPSTKLLGKPALIVKVASILVLDSPRRQVKGNWSPHIFRLEVDGVPHDVSIRFGRRVRFLKLCSAFASHPPFAASLCCHDAISGAVNKDCCDQ